MGAIHLNAPISHIVSTPNGAGYWLVAGDGGVFSFGDAQFYGSMGGKPLNAPVMDIIPTSNGAGYWLVATDGGIFSFGNAQFYGSMGGTRLNAPVNGGSFAQGGYRMVANDGGIFDFGGAQFYGSMGGHPLNQPIVGMADTPDGAGYWEVASDGGIFTFGDAPFYGSTGGNPPSTPVVGWRSTMRPVGTGSSTRRGRSSTTTPQRTGWLHNNSAGSGNFFSDPAVGPKNRRMVIRQRPTKELVPCADPPESSPPWRACSLSQRVCSPPPPASPLRHQWRCSGGKGQRRLGGGVAPGRPPVGHRHTSTRPERLAP